MRASQNTPKQRQDLIVTRAAAEEIVAAAAATEAVVYDSTRSSSGSSSIESNSSRSILYSIGNQPRKRRKKARARNRSYICSTRVRIQWRRLAIIYS